MSYHQEGYDQGYQDALDGKAPPESGILYDLISYILDMEGQQEWENGYREGYADGKEEQER
jgi:hypothetical protein